MQAEVRYLFPHKREGGTLENVVGERPNAAKTTALKRIFAQTNPFTQPRVYEGGFSFNGGLGGGGGGGGGVVGGSMQPPTRVNGNWGQVQQVPQQVQQVPQQPFVQPVAIPDFRVIREAIQELYGPSLRKIGCPEFYKPYPKMIDRENPYPRGYRILDFSLFSGEARQSTLEHVARFTVQCEELANYENFYRFKLRLFPNSLTRATFTWYTTLPRNSIQSWQEMERQFHTQFFKAEPEVCIVELSRVTQRNGETVDFFISRFKKMRNICKIHLLETEYVKRT